MKGDGFLTVRWTSGGPKRGLRRYCRWEGATAPGNHFPSNAATFPEIIVMSVRFSFFYFDGPNLMQLSSHDTLVLL